MRSQAAARAVIDLARGVLMERLGCSAAEARAQLAALSQGSRTSVTELAAQITGQLPPEAAAAAGAPAPDAAGPIPANGTGPPGPAGTALAGAAMELADDGDQLAAAVLEEALVPAGAAAVALWLTEPDAGSDPSAMRTTARRDGDGWVLNGAKMWITNGSRAGVAVVWAKTDEGVRGFLVPAGTDGFRAIDVKDKLSLVASTTSELVLEDCRLGADSLLPGASSLRGPLACLNEARYGIVWGAVGAARACLEAAIEYTATRVAFGGPIAARQIVQQELVEMHVAVNNGLLLATRIGRLKDQGRVTPEHISYGKFNNVRMATDVARRARALLGANGITLEYPVMRHLVNLESVLTYEGTHQIHTLILGKALTGHAAFE